MAKPYTVPAHKVPVVILALKTRIEECERMILARPELRVYWEAEKHKANDLYNAVWSDAM